MIPSFISNKDNNKTENNKTNNFVQTPIFPVWTIGQSKYDTGFPQKMATLYYDQQAADETQEHDELSCGSSCCFGTAKVTRGWKVESMMWSQSWSCSVEDNVMAHYKFAE